MDTVGRQVCVASIQKTIAFKNEVNSHYFALFFLITILLL